MSVAYVLDDIFIEHQPPGAHPERPERVVAVRDALRAAGLERRGTRLPTRAATEAELGAVHSGGYIDDLVSMVPGRAGWLDPDTYFSPATWNAALAAAGAVIDLTGVVLSGRFQSGIAVIRPPGHHAEADRAMGFCLINNVAVAAAHARAAGAARVAIVDWDVHHGNGTQNIFYADPRVLYVSTHQSPAYPGTGAPTELGAGEGRGANINLALPAGSGDREYLAAFDEVIVPSLRAFAPDIILISAGFDAYFKDPLAQMKVTTAGYRAMAERLRLVAGECCDGRLVCALEGGYDLTGLSEGVVAVLDAFDSPGRDGDSGSRARPAVDRSGDIAPRARAAIDSTKSAIAALTRSPLAR